MNNISYTIEEGKIDNSLNKQEDYVLDFEEYKIHESNESNESNEYIARQIDYDMNYTSKYLGQILEYYGIKKGKMNKREIIIKIVEFEMNPENTYIVDTRKRLFDNFLELKNDSFFSKYIVGTL